ncbi:MAG: hypothetical protein ACK44A_03645 [Roseateles sp.]
MTPVRFQHLSESTDHVVMVERIVRWERSSSNWGSATRIVLDTGEAITVGESVDDVERKVREAARQ